LSHGCSDHIEAGVLVSGTNGIIANAGANDKVALEDLDIEDLGTGLNGVQIVARAGSNRACPRFVYCAKNS
jgi:hypothetical protein